MAYFQWVNAASAAAPANRPPLLINMDETDDGHFMAVRGPITLRHLRFRLTDLEGQVVRLRGSSLSFVLFLDHV